MDSSDTKGIVMNCTSVNSICIPPCAICPELHQRTYSDTDLGTFPHFPCQTTL